MSNNQTHADALARVHTAEAMGVIVKAMRGQILGLKPEAQLRAAETIVDRGHGRAVQATISIPARQATAIRLAGMSNAELLRIAKGGRGEQNGGPIGPGVVGGTYEGELAPNPNACGEGDSGEGDGDSASSSQELPTHLAGCDIVDAELDFDPCS